MELKRVVVTGLGAVTPLGNNPEETWQSMLAGKSGAAPITHFDTTQFKTQFACEVKNLNINDYIDRKEARKLDRYTQLALISAIQGVKDAAIDLEKVDKNRVGVIYGVGIGGIKTFEDEVTYYAQHAEAGPKFNPFFIPKMIADIAAGQISIQFGFHGPNYTQHQHVLHQQMHWLLPSTRYVWARLISSLAVVLRLQSVLVVLVVSMLCMPSQPAMMTQNMLHVHSQQVVMAS